MSLILFPTWIVVNDVNFGFDKVIQWVLRRHKVFTHEEERLFVRSLLCPFILLLNGWTCSPTYCNPQTWQSRRLSTLGVLQLTGKEYKIFCNVNCKTTIVVYRLECHVCGSQYAGESVQPFNKRMNGHRSDLTKQTLLHVSQHFVSPGHSLDDFVRSKIYIIDHNPSWKENQRH
jgi:hypothetical protein